MFKIMIQSSAYIPSNSTNSEFSLVCIFDKYAYIPIMFTLVIENNIQHIVANSFILLLLTYVLSNFTLLKDKLTKSLI
jgi:hypothetical protein